MSVEKLLCSVVAPTPDEWMHYKHACSCNLHGPRNDRQPIPSPANNFWPDYFLTSSLPTRNMVKRQGTPMHSSQFAQGAYVGSGTSNLRSKVMQFVPLAVRHSKPLCSRRNTLFHMWPAA